jgi:hypothetical protein
MSAPVRSAAHPTADGDRPAATHSVLAFLLERIQCSRFCLRRLADSQIRRKEAVKMLLCFNQKVKESETGHILSNGEKGKKVTAG